MPGSVGQAVTFVYISASFFGNTLWMTWLMKSVTGTDRNTLALCRLSLADCVF